LSQKTIDRFFLGASINNKQITDLFLREKNDFCSSDDLLFTNLIQVNDNNQAYDYFVARQLIFPLHNEKGKIVAFAARKLEISPAESKYTYLSNHQLYHKSSLLYNYLPVRENRSEECYLVEGFFDVISLNQIGIENCLAILGTSLSTTHLLLLRELKKRIILFLDGDEAGREATINIAIKLLSQEIDCEVIEHDYQSDPDDICQQHDLTAVHHILRQRKNPYLFILGYYQEK
jgi:DNA primase